jgi:hypothetical protein
VQIATCEVHGLRDQGFFANRSLRSAGPKNRTPIQGPAISFRERSLTREKTLAKPIIGGKIQLDAPDMRFPVTHRAGFPPVSITQSAYAG